MYWTIITSRTYLSMTLLLHFPHPYSYNNLTLTSKMYFELFFAVINNIYLLTIQLHIYPKTAFKIMTWSYFNAALNIDYYPNYLQSFYIFALSFTKLECNQLSFSHISAFTRLKLFVGFLWNYLLTYFAWQWSIHYLWDKIASLWSSYTYYYSIRNAF